MTGHIKRFRLDKTELYHSSNTSKAFRYKHIV